MNYNEDVYIPQDDPADVQRAREYLVLLIFTVYLC